MSSGANWKEDEIGQKFDRCLTDATVKLGAGTALGVVFSLLFFKRKRWPIITGAGFGLGSAYTNCEKEINATIRN